VSVPLRLLFIALACSPLAAEAGPARGLHQLCFEDDRVRGGSLVTLACRADDPSITCEHKVPSGWVRTSVTRRGLNELIATYRTPLRANQGGTSWFTFSDGTLRPCTVDLGFPGDGSLVGYTTDESGRVSTGVWFDPGRAPNGPAAFRAVGGGALGAPGKDALPVETNSPAYELPLREGPPYQWFAQRDVQGYTIGLHIEGIQGSALWSLVEWTYARGSVDVLSQATALLPPGRVLVGGGASGSVSYDEVQRGVHHLIDSSPALDLECVRWQHLEKDPFGRCAEWSVRGVLGWNAATRSRHLDQLAAASAHVLSLPETLTIDGLTYDVRTVVTLSESGVDANPAAFVAGLAGEYALTSIGAQVSEQAGPLGSLGSGNFLWAMVPHPLEAGAEVASTDWGGSSQARVTAFAVGVKLVPR